MNDEKLIINFTPTGMIPQKKQSPFVPIQTVEIVEEVLQACDIGITMVHLHARNAISEEPDYKAELYAEMISGIRKYAKDLVICVSLSGRTFSEFEKRIDPLKLENDLKPDMGSLTLGSVNFNSQASINTPEMIVNIVTEMNKRGVKPELEAFDLGMINYAKYLIKKKLLHPPYYFNLILGNVACAQVNLMHMSVMVADLPAQSLWSAGGIGNFQLSANVHAIFSGGGVRTGLEDNLWYDKKRTRLAKNTDLLRRIQQIADISEREIMKPGDLRRKLELREGGGRYGCETD